MRALMLTQAVDLGHPILGFTHGWVRELARQVDQIHVLALARGRCELPQKVSVRALGGPGERTPRSRRRGFYCRQLARSILGGLVDLVLVHMVPRCVIAAAAFCGLRHLPRQTMAAGKPATIRLLLAQRRTARRGPDRPDQAGLGRMDSPRNSNQTEWRFLRRLYDRRAEEQYPFVPGRGPRSLSRKHQGLIAHMDFAVRSRVLDAGCGDGVYCEWLTRRGHALVVGIDISERILATARRNTATWGGASATYFSAGNLEQLPLADTSFDAVVCSQVVEHLLDDRAALKELQRVLIPGGRLVLSTDNRDNHVTRWLAAPVRLIRKLLRLRAWECPFPHQDYRLPELVALVSEAGFRVEYAESYRFSLTPSLARMSVLRRLVDWAEATLIRLPGVRRWGDIIVVVACRR